MAVSLHLVQQWILHRTLTETALSIFRTLAHSTTQTEQKLCWQLFGLDGSFRANKQIGH